MTTRPMTLPSVDRASVAGRRLRSLPRAPLDLQNGRVRIEPTPAVDDLFAGPAVTAKIAWGATPLQVTCPSELVTALLSELDPRLRVETLPPDLLAILVEAALLRDVTAFEARSGCTVRCTRVAEAAPSLERGLRLDFARGDRRWPVRLHGPESSLAALLLAWPAAPRDWSDLPIRAAVRVGTTRLPLVVLRSLAPADTVLLESRPPNLGVLVLAEAWIAGLEPQGDAGRLTEAPHAPSGLEQEWIMRRDNESGGADEPVGTLDELPVQVAFDLGRIELPLGEVRRLGPGAVIETGRRVDGFVRISANGRLIGHGTLVDIEGQVGVEIVRLFDHG